MSSQLHDLLLSVVIPVYNDEEVLEELCRRLVPVVQALSTRYEIIFIDDGSRDRSWDLLRTLHASYPHMKLLKMARNFGQDGATTAGLHHALGDIVVIMDSDLQDRPEDIPRLIDAMLSSGKAMAITRWQTRRDGFFKVAASRFFQAVTNRITDLRHERGLGVFRAIRREVVDSLLEMPETTASSLSKMYWLGFEYAIVDLQRDARFAGSSGYTLGRMLRLALDRIFSFSIFPIRLAVFFGFALSASSAVLAIYLLLRRLILEHVAAGWTSVMVVTLFLAGMNFLFLGVIGEYLGRIFLETKHRQKYVISKVLQSRPASGHVAEADDHAVTVTRSHDA